MNSGTSGERVTISPFIVLSRLQQRKRKKNSHIRISNTQHPTQHIVHTYIHTAVYTLRFVRIFRAVKPDISPITFNGE